MQNSGTMYNKSRTTFKAGKDENANFTQKTVSAKSFSITHLRKSEIGRPLTVRESVVSTGHNRATTAISSLFKKYTFF